MKTHLGLGLGLGCAKGRGARGVRGGQERGRTQESVLAMAGMKAAGKGTVWTRGAAAAAAGKKGEIIKSPSMLLSYVVALSSMLVGASIVHNILKPDLTIPALDQSEKDEASMKDIGDVSSRDD